MKRSMMVVVIVDEKILGRRRAGQIDAVVVKAVTK
jgi:hypothetical protein